MATPPERKLAQFAARNLGLFAHGHAVDFGYTNGQISRRVRSGRWEHLYRGVYRIAGTPMTWDAGVLAACWASPQPAAASHRSAMALWALPGGRRMVVEVIARRGSRSQHPGVIAHETTNLPDHHSTRLGAIPVTTAARTLVDAAAVLHPSVLQEAVDEAIRRGLVTQDAVLSCVDEIGANGRRGARHLVRVLGRSSSSAAQVESVMESRVLRALRRFGAPEPAMQHEVRVPGATYRLDFAYPNQRLGIEFDSYLHHGGPAKFTRDLARRNALTAAGWTVIHVTAADLRDAGRRLSQTVVQLLEAAA